MSTKRARSPTVVLAAAVAAIASVAAVAADAPVAAVDAGPAVEALAVVGGASPAGNCNDLI